MSSFKKGKSIRSQAREVINNVTAFCERESMAGSLQVPLQQVQKRAATATGVSVTTVKKVKRHFIELEDNPSGGGIFTAPGGHRKRACAYIDDVTKCAIRHVINEYYLERKMSPSVPRLLTLLREKVDFPWQSSTFRKTLLSMDYRWWRWGQIKPVLMEKPEIVAFRNKFLRTMKKYRENQRVVVYVGEMWIDNNLTFRKYWLNNNTSGAQADANSENCLVVAHAGTRYGFVQNAHLVYETGSSTGDYRGQMDYLNFEKWLQEKLLPNIPPHSVICMSSAPHHFKKADPVPSKYSPKKVMVNWLIDRSIAVSPNMRKPQLFELIQQHAPETVLYRVDRIINEAGHDVMRIPLHHGDLNAIEFVFSSVERFIKEKSADVDLSVPILQDLLMESFEEIGPKLWKEYCLHVESLENKYWETDGLVEEILDEIILNAGGCVADSSTDDSACEFSSSDSDSDF